ncbi:MAG TPA: hypothetical protein VNW92_04185, partial [Polyangiaceae bacterium]|nr:hypothetical protein [Polyangiaceae bacterium]
MKALSRVSLLLLLGASVLAACSSSDPEPSVAQSREALLLPCPTPQFGMACDPDGAGVLGECDGLCGFDATSPSGKIVCNPIATLGVPNLDHYLCGSGTSCTQTCNASGQCVTAAALDGTPCAASNPNSKCSGKCESGACQSIASPCPFGRDTCVFDTCAAFDATSCIGANYPTTTACTGAGGSGGAGVLCDGCGVCSSSGPGVCPSGGAGGSGGSGGASGSSGA